MSEHAPQLLMPTPHGELHVVRERDASTFTLDGQPVTLAQAEAAVAAKIADENDGATASFSLTDPGCMLRIDSVEYATTPDWA